MSGGTVPQRTSASASKGTSQTAPRHEHVVRDASAVLRAHRLQVTPQRVAVIDAVATQPHSTADDIGAAVRERIGTISRQAVYDALTTLTEHGVLRRIQPAGSSARYEDRVGDNHHHLICRSCNRMVDVDCAVGDVPCLTPSDHAGFDIDEAEVTFWGLCPDCAAKDGPRATPPSTRTTST